ncbi:MAG: hypothetical protein AB7N76_35070, partial [Planctomycetota bacterium]
PRLPAKARAGSSLYVRERLRVSQGPKARRVGCESRRARAPTGKSASGQLFFITGPFGGRSPRRDFLAVYRFDSDGRLLEATIDEREAGQTLAAAAAKVMARIGPVSLQDIEVELFEVERHGLRFGLAPVLSDEDDPPAGSCVAVDLVPGNYMSFVPPWDGDYDT